MYVYYLIIISAFVLFIFYDFNQICGNKKQFRFLFPIGTIILVSSSIRIAVCGNESFLLPVTLRIIFGICSIIFLIALIYTLFFAIPFEDTYIEGSKQKLCTTGIYSFCRHPGVLFLSGVYLFVGLTICKTDFLICGAICTVCNIIYIIIQDKITFPKLFEGYEEYQKTTPFLIPRPMRKD